MLNDELVTSYSVNSSHSLGITIKALWMPGCVPEYEEHQVRSKVGYTLNQWRKLEPEERAMEIALERINSSIEYQRNLKEERAAKHGGI